MRGDYHAFPFGAFGAEDGAGVVFTTPFLVLFSAPRTAL